MADPLTIDKRFGVKRGSPVTASTSGNTTIYTPQPGRRVRLTWLGLSSPSSNTDTVLAIIKWSGGSEIYRWHMSAPGAFAHSSIREGGVDESLLINLNGSQVVEVNIDVEEF